MPSYDDIFRDDDDEDEEGNDSGNDSDGGSEPSGKRRRFDEVRIKNNEKAPLISEQHNWTLKVMNL